MPTERRLAITIGDPAGIGPEVVLKALASPKRPDLPIDVYGSVEILEGRARSLHLSSPRDLGVQLIDVPLTGPGPTPLGEVSASAGRAAAEAVIQATYAALKHTGTALVTAPLNKASLHAAGYPWPGHTELLAATAGVTDVAMMFFGGGLRVALVTIHQSLRSVPESVTQAEIGRIVRLVHRELPRLGVLNPRIALCGINPHAGEEGLFGREEQETLIPAVTALRAEKIHVSGPFAADTLFSRAQRGEFDVVIANYHDQGLIPVKLLAFGESVNVTIGLPFIRTSVDHGTGFDIVHEGRADASSLLAAMDLAAHFLELREAV